MKLIQYLLCVSVLSLLSLQAMAVESVTRHVQDFESLTAVPAAWTAEGGVRIDEKKAFNSKRALLLERSQEDVNTKTMVTMAAMPVQAGIWEVQFFWDTNVYSPDSSFNGTLYLEYLDAKGERVGRKEVRVMDGKRKWREDRSKAIIPETATHARFQVVMKKTWGEIRLDNLVLNYLGPAPSTIFSHIKLAPKAYGALFEPGTDVAYDIKVECSKAWQESAPAISVSLTDYWGAEYKPAFDIALKKSVEKPGYIAYTGTLQFDHSTLEAGKYYEVRTVVHNGDKDRYTEKSAFSIQPQPITKNYDPFEIPFTLNNWDDRIKDTFFMADRMGIRWKLIWSGWETTPPYKTYAPGIEWTKELGMGALLGFRPISTIEKQRDGWDKITEEALRQGAFNLIDKYKDMPIMIRCGNEPHTEPEHVKHSVAAYKAVYEGAKKAKPDVFFIGTSVGTVEEFFKQGFQDYCDAFDFHTYSGWKHLRTINQNYQDLFKKYNVEPKPIFCTEIGLNSQGMARVDVSRDMIKKFAIFFAEGNANLAWFNLLYPDPKGTIVGSNGEAFNVFQAKYTLYHPKITAVTYFNLVNGICIKKFVEEKIYPEEIEAVLFRDREDQCLAVIWDEQSRGEHFLPMPGVGKVKLIRIDGSVSELDAGGKGLNLSFSEDPLLLFFESADFAFADKLGEPGVSLATTIPAVVKGSSSTVALALNGVEASGLQWRMPPGWSAEAITDGVPAGEAHFKVSAPDMTNASVGMLSVGHSALHTELSVPMTVKGKLGLTVLPHARNKDAESGIRLLIRNNGMRDEAVQFEASIPEEMFWEKGTFHKSHAKPFAPVSSVPFKGEIVVPAQSEQAVLLPVTNLNPKNIYKVRAVITGAQTERIDVERFMAGNLGVPKISQPLDVKTAHEDARWQQCLPVHINDVEQYYWLRKDFKESSWDSVADLSGTLRFLWDDTHLYMRADVIDDVYHNKRKRSHLWAMDGVQLFIDPARPVAQKAGYYDISCGQGSEGDQAWCHSSAHPSVLAGQAKGFQVHTTMNGQTRTHVIAIPWAHVAPFKAAAGKNLGMSVILNEDDGPGRGGFMGWFSGVHSKQLDLVGDLILLDE